MSSLAASEFILNKDGSIYHLNLFPEDLAETIITVGDPDRVEKVTKFFDEIELQVRKREFHTQTGKYKGKRISVISTGIGTDNIDIVLNELDALANIDFQSRRIKEVPKVLEIIRIGTSGAIQPEIKVDTFVKSELAFGFDSLLHFYHRENNQNENLENALAAHLKLSPEKNKPYVAACSSKLSARFSAPEIIGGITGTNVGFYGPQGRILRLPLQDPLLNDKIQSFEFQGRKITNLEMETAGIYGLAELLGHEAISLNAIIANRCTGQFSNDPEATTAHLIKYTLDQLVS